MKRVLMFLIVCLIVPGLVAFSGEQKKVKKGAEQVMVSGSLVQWKNIEKVDFTKTPGKRVMKPVMNFANPKKIIKKSNAADPVVQTGFGRDSRDLGRGTLAMPTPIIHFAGMNLSANGAGWPPDTNGDVGLNYYIQVVNTSIGIYNKTTGAPVSTTTFDAFFPSSVGSPCDNYNNGDPIVHFDPYSQRWVLYDFAWSGSGDGSYFSIAASKTSDPTGAWWTYCFHADNTLVNDYPKSGVWQDGIYVTANMFSFSGGFQYAKVWALKKPDLYNGTLVVQSITDNAWEAWSILPTNAKGSTAPPAGTPNFMYALDADEYGSPGIDAIYWWKFYVDWANPANTLWDGSYVMNVAAYTLTASEVPQPGTSNTLDSLFGRLMYPAIYRNFGSYASVYLNHVCDVSGRKAERWYEIRINSGTSSIYQQGTYSPDTNHRWMGSIAGDKNGNIALGYSVSSSSLYPAIRYAGRLAADPLGQLSQGEASMIEGTGSQTSYNRWGDYSGMSIDPTDDETFWYTNEYYITTGTNWQTRIGAFKFSSTPPPPPAAPSNLTAAAPLCNRIDLGWTDNATNENGFKIERGLNSTTFSQIATVGANVTAYSDSSVAAQTQYWYRVRAYNAGGDSAYSNTANATTPQCTGNPPAAPTIRRVQPGRTNVRIRWSDNATDETGYRVYRGLSAGSLSLIATLPANTTSYNNTGLARGTTYYYKVCAYNSNGEGCSAVFSARTR